MSLPLDIRAVIPPHPATFRDQHLAVARNLLWKRDQPFVKTVLDPFAGVGTIHRLREWNWTTWGIEREPEWAAASPFTIVGDAREAKLVLTRANVLTPFDVVITSPCFGNRMADHHEAKDDSVRNTYRHKLGRPIEPGSSAIMQWGPEYREFHEAVWREVTDITSHLFILNIKDHIRGGKVMPVVDFHVSTLEDLGWMVKWTEVIDSPGNRFGENSEVRVPQEMMILFRRVR